MRYTLIEQNTREKIEQAVNEHLGRGWRLHGPTQVTAGPESDEHGYVTSMYYYYQAMVKEADDEE